MTTQTSTHSQDNPMTFTITPNTSVASLAQTIINNHSRQKAASLLADMYNKQMEYMMASLAIAVDAETVRFVENIEQITIITKAYDIHRDMHVARLKTMPYRG